MKTLYMWLLMVVAYLPIHSQNSIQGVVTDTDTNQPLAYANIYLPKLEKGTLTDENGEFSISNLPNGEQKVIVSIIGYETYETTVSLPMNNTLEISLYASVIEMDEVILSTPFHKLQKDNVMKVEQKKASELKANGALTLADGINAISGVSSISTGIGIGKPVIRGLSSNRVLVYAQGIRLENQQFGDEHGLGINDSGIESVEVIKGPASLLYGSDALGGVLYVNPERFASVNSSSGDLNFNYFTNTQGYNTNAGFKTSTDTFQFILRGSVAEHSDYKTKNYRVTNTRFREQDLKAALGYHISNFSTEFRYNLNASQLGIPEEFGIQSLSKDPLLPNQNIHNHIFSSKSKLHFDKSSLELNLGFTYNDRKEFEEHHHDEDEHDDEDHDEEEEDHDEDEHDDEDHDEEEEGEAALHMKLQTFNYDLKYNLPKLGRFETIVGIQGMNQTNTNYGEEELIPNATTNDFGVLATSHIHFETVDFQLGVRYDKRTIDIDGLSEKNFNSFNGAFGVKKDFSDAFTGRLNLASGFRAPNLAELTSDGVHHGTNRYEIGNPDLDNEQNFQVDLAFEYNSEHIEVFVNGFYNRVNNYIYLSPNGSVIDDAPAFEYLQDDAKLYGGEVGIHFHPHPLDWLHIENTFETVTGKQDNNDYLPLIPANNLTNTVRVEFENKWLKKAYSFIRLSSTFDQNNVSGFETSTKGYSLLSIGVGGELEMFNNPLFVRVSGNNLTDKNYINHLSRLKPDGLYNIGRNINFSLTYKM